MLSYTFIHIYTRRSHRLARRLFSLCASQLLDLYNLLQVKVRVALVHNTPLTLFLRGMPSKPRHAWDCYRAPNHQSPPKKYRNKAQDSTKNCRSPNKSQEAAHAKWADLFFINPHPLYPPAAKLSTKKLINISKKSQKYGARKSSRLFSGSRSGTYTLDDHLLIYVHSTCSASVCVCLLKQYAPNCWAIWQPVWFVGWDSISVWAAIMHERQIVKRREGKVNRK